MATQKLTGKGKIGLTITIIADIILVVFIIGIITYMHAVPANGASPETPFDDTLGPGIESSFELSSQEYDINGEQQYVVYTNYACPFCAVFYEQTRDLDYTTRIYLTSNESARFENQNAVSAYMLKLSKTNMEAYGELEQWLFENQNEWIDLNEAEVIELMNARSGYSWTNADLAVENDLCLLAQADAPDDLEHVPSLYSDGIKYEEYVLSHTQA